jgi:L,D-transpeptidase ErfK/SrfK
MRVTHGCVRLYPEDVAQLFELVPVGTPVNIINQPAKAGWQGGTLYLEVHPVLDGNDQLLPPDLVAIRQVVTRAAGDYADTIDWSTVDAIAYEAGGIPVSLATRP